MLKANKRLRLFLFAPCLMLVAACSIGPDRNRARDADPLKHLKADCGVSVALPVGRGVLEATLRAQGVQSYVSRKEYGEGSGDLIFPAGKDNDRYKEAIVAICKSEKPFMTSGTSVRYAFYIDGQGAISRVEYKPIFEY